MGAFKQRGDRWSPQDGACLFVCHFLLKDLVDGRLNPRKEILVEIKLEVCPTEESKFQLVKIALLLRDPNASYQDLIDLMNPRKAQPVNSDSGD